MYDILEDSLTFVDELQIKWDKAAEQTTLFLSDIVLRCGTIQLCELCLL